MLCKENKWKEACVLCLRRKGKEEEENPLEPRHPSFVVTRVTIGKLLVCRATTKDSV
jgi:hypothetical protein